MVDADLAAAAAVAVVVEEAAGQVDGADAVEVDGDPVVVLLVAVVDGGHGAERPVADVGATVTLGVEVTVRGSSGDTVADGEVAVVAGDDLVGADLAVDLTELVGEAVQLAAGGVAPVDHRVVVAFVVGVPPAGEDVPVHGEVVVDDVEVPGPLEVIEGVVDPAVAQGFGGRPVVGVTDPMGGDQFGGVALVTLAEHSEHAARSDRSVLGRVADEPQRRPCGSGHPHELVEVAVRQRRGLVDHEHRPGVEGVGVGVVVDEVPGDRFALDPGGRRECASGLALDGRADHSVADRLPRLSGGGDAGGLAGAGPSDGRLESVPARAPRRDQCALFLGEVRVRLERGGKCSSGRRGSPLGGGPWRRGP